MSPSSLHDLANDLAAGGLARHEAAVLDVVRVARSVGCSPVLVAILADRTEPEIARLRAFGHVATILARQPAVRRGGLVAA
jgi:hypothetical protein